MHLIQSLKNEFCFDLPMFSKYPATSINRYFYKMTLVKVGRWSLLLVRCLKICSFLGLPLVLYNLEFRFSMLWESQDLMWSFMKIPLTKFLPAQVVELWLDDPWCLCWYQHQRTKVFQWWIWCHYQHQSFGEIQLLFYS